MKRHRFVSRFRPSVELPDFDQATIKAEPCFFSASPQFATEHGGPITRAFLDAIGAAGDGYIFDSRTHMLMPGWFPCIPGFHHDDVPRSRADGQPNYDNPEYRSQHVMALVNGDIAPTEFAVGIIELDDIPPGSGPIYKHWHAAIEAAIERGDLAREAVPSNRLIYFDCDAFHQGVMATGGGFRWFGRLSWDTARRPVNELRNQTQVYLPFPMEGW